MDQETISLHVTQFLQFFRRYHDSHTQFQALCEFLETHNTSNLQLTYSWLNLTPPCIHTNLDLPAGINVKFDRTQLLVHRVFIDGWVFSSRECGNIELKVVHRIGKSGCHSRRRFGTRFLNLDPWEGFRLYLLRRGYGPLQLDHSHG